jgi:hypothetical protein
MDGDVIYTCRFYNLDESDRLAVGAVSKDVKKQLRQRYFKSW